MLKTKTLLAKATMLLACAAAISSCSKEKPPGSPTETAIRMKQAVTFNEYDRFQALFMEQRKSQASRELFEQLKATNGAKADFKSYTLVTMENGEMLLVNHTPDNTFQIQDVIKVPDNMKSFFQNLNR
ncbi:hypothetical protein [Paenibacillus thalictri]|uniref:Lipoprotein n=1 Tax=Paenibacillus thalictri TaxID=2527873 RepID=A0A4Q9DWV9_9BACL|nr:hypothetical protein [Paenibacillus thalictri]TBL81559.1 hypothetical protein EYB31_00660 [Paenibacillus thalictri]